MKSFIAFSAALVMLGGVRAQEASKSAAKGPIAEAAKMTEKQRVLLLKLLLAYADRMPADVAELEMNQVKEAGIDVKIVGTDLTTFIKRAELARDRGEQRPERFAVGEKVDARVIQFDRRAHKVQVSIKALEVAEEKEAIAQYGSSDSGATLGDILGTALKRASEKPNEK